MFWLENKEEEWSCVTYLAELTGQPKSIQRPSRLPCQKRCACARQHFRWVQWTQVQCSRVKQVSELVVILDDREVRGVT